MPSPVSRPRRPATLRHTLTATLALLAMAPVAALTLGTEGCPMAHCDGRMSDLTNAVGPTTAVAVSVDRTAPPAVGGLGCVSNTRLVACTGGGDPALTSNLIVYDADGNRLWDDGGLLGATAWKSVPILGSDDRLIAADQDTVLMADLKTGQIDRQQTAAGVRGQAVGFDGLFHGTGQAFVAGAVAFRGQAGFGREAPGLGDAVARRLAHHVVTQAQRSGRGAGRRGRGGQHLRAGHRDRSCATCPTLTRSRVWCATATWPGWNTPCSSCSRSPASSAPSSGMASTGS